MVVRVGWGPLDDDFVHGVARWKVIVDPRKVPALSFDGGVVVGGSTFPSPPAIKRFQQSIPMSGVVQIVLG